MGFIEHKHNLVLYGPVGVGKTHMAIAAGVNACRKGYKVNWQRPGRMEHSRGSAVI